MYVYDKTDDQDTATATLSIRHVVFLEKHRTADYQTTSGIRKILENNGNRDDLLAFLEERRLPVDEVEANHIVDELLREPPQLGYLTISNALQWRLQYTRAIEHAGATDGLRRVH